MIEISDILDFFLAHPPFDQMERQQLKEGLHGLQAEYFPKNGRILEIGQENMLLHIVRSGAVELHDSEDNLVARLGEGDCFGYISLLSGKPVRYRAVAGEDTLIFHLPAESFRHLRRTAPGFDHFFTEAFAERLNMAIRDRGGSELAATRLGDLARRELVQMDCDNSVAEVAAVMTEKGVSSILLSEDGRVAGILTDKDLRRRVVASRLPYDTPVRDIMTRDPIVARHDSNVAEALLIMMQRNIHHLPVLRDQTPIGLLTLADLLRIEAEHPIYMAGDILKQEDSESIARVSKRLPELIQRMIGADATADQIGKVVTTVTDAITKRLIQLAVRKLGPPPVKFAWLALGSQGRQEQSAKSDQDNALLLDDDFLPEHDAYFEQLAVFVSDGLAACGYVYCPGEVMASNPRWRQPLKVWKGYFRRWIAEPEPKALMYADIFFDLRIVDGHVPLVNELKDHIAALARTNQFFLAMMAKNAMAFQPPLGFFRQFVLQKGGGHEDSLDLKHRGVIPIVGLARIYSLAGGEVRVNSRRRLQSAVKTGQITEGTGRSLEDALELIDFIRMSHQWEEMKNGQPPSNFVPPTFLSPLQRQHLKAAFSVVRTAQAALLNRFGLS
jgi:CBS domain-containing protein